MGPRGRLAWIPPFVLGFVGAAAGEIAGGLLLYSTDGLLRAATVLLATMLGALALGLRVAGGSAGRGEADRRRMVRRRWLFGVAAFAAAAGFAGVWEWAGGAASPLSQGLGLAFLGGLPLYAVGSLLGAMEVAGTGAGSAVGTAAWAAAGAGAGVAVTGLALIPRLQAVSVLLLCVILTSGAALLHGHLEDGEADPVGAGPP